MHPEPTNATIPLSNIPTHPLTWLWPGRLPQGKLTLLDSTPGSGTSLFALTLAACLSSGNPLPDGTPTPQSHVLLITPHDDAASAREAATTFSAHRQAILRILHESPTPRAARDIAEHIGYDYDCVRKMLFRLLLEGELTASSRGQYTLPNHPCLTGNQPSSSASGIPPTSTTPAANPEPHTSHVPNVSTIPTRDPSMSHLPPSVPLPTSSSSNPELHLNNFPSETNVPTLPWLEPSTASDTPTPRCAFSQSAPPFEILEPSSE